MPFEILTHSFLLNGCKTKVVKDEDICDIVVGEASGKGPRGLATKLQGRGSMQYVQNQASSGTSEVAKAHKVGTRTLRTVMYLTW